MEKLVIIPTYNERENVALLLKNVFELGAETLEIIGASVDYPISPQDNGTDFLMENRHLWIRSKRQAAILRVRHEIISAIRD